MVRNEDEITQIESRVEVFFEVFQMSEKLKKLIAAKANDSELRQVAIREGMTTLREDAWRKVQAGLTTVEEALRVTGETENG